MNEREMLFQLLHAEGWEDQAESIISPGRTIWLNRTCPWQGTLQDFHEQMSSRLNRIQNAESVFGEASGFAAQDTATLVDCLKSILHSS